MQELLAGHGQGAVLLHVAGIEAVLPVGDADDDDPAVTVQEVAALFQRFEGFLLVLVHGDEGDLFQQGVAGALARGRVGGDGAVRLAQDAQHEMLAQLVQLAGKERAGSAALRDDGEAVELHQVLVDEHAVAFVDLAVAVDEFADAHAEALERICTASRKRLSSSRRAMATGPDVV